MPGLQPVSPTVDPIASLQGLVAQLVEVARAKPEEAGDLVASITRLFLELAADNVRLRQAPPWHRGAPSSEGLYWLGMHDQGGWPFVSVGQVYGKHTEDFQERQAAWVAWMEGGKVGERPPDPTIELWVRIPSLQVDSLLADVWNIRYFLDLPAPPDHPVEGGVVEPLQTPDETPRDVVGVAP